MMAGSTMDTVGERVVVHTRSSLPVQLLLEPLAALERAAGGSANNVVAGA